MQHFKKNLLAAALLCGFASFAGAQNAGSTSGTTAATPATSPTTGATTGTTTATITTQSGRTATADIPTTTAPNTGTATTDTPTGLEHTAQNAAPDTTTDTTAGPDSTLDDTRGSSVAAQARANRGQGQDTTAAVRAANPSSQNARAGGVLAAPSFDTLDINKDGWVALSELPVGNTQLSSSFPDLDADGDSRLSRAEFDAVLTADSGEMDEDSEAE